jgi:hypothetical protein
MTKPTLMRLISASIQRENANVVIEWLHDNRAQGNNSVLDLPPLPSWPSEEPARILSEPARDPCAHEAPSFRDEDFPPLPSHSNADSSPSSACSSTRATVSFTQNRARLYRSLCISDSEPDPLQAHSRPSSPQANARPKRNTRPRETLGFYITQALAQSSESLSSSSAATSGSEYSPIDLDMRSSRIRGDLEWRQSRARLPF